MHLFAERWTTKLVMVKTSCGRRLMASRGAALDGLRGSIALAVTTLLLAACSTEPFQVVPPTPENPQPGVVLVQPPTKVTALPAVFVKPVRSDGLGPFDYDPRPRILSLCYSSQLNTPRQVLLRAGKLCPQDGKVALIDQDVFFNGCSIFQPQRATFRCIPGPAPEPKYK